MKKSRFALRYFISALTICLACATVGFAQTPVPPKKGVVAKPTVNKVMEEWRRNWVSEWERARDYTKEYLDAMPEDGLGFKPDPKIRSFAEQMLHLASANFTFASAAAGTTSPYTPQALAQKEDLRQSKAALTKVVIESYDFMMSSVKSMNLLKAGEELKLFDRFATTRSGAIAKAFEHQTHHRGQMTIYLRLKGVTPPAEKLF